MQPNFQKANKTKIETKYIKFVPKYSVGTYGHWDYIFKPCKVEIGTKKLDNSEWNR